MSNLRKLENYSIFILREAYSEFRNLCMLWSIGKDSSVLLWLTRKAFFGHVPFPLIHIDTSYKIPEMIEHRDHLVREWKLDLIYGINDTALEKKLTYPDGNTNRIECCKALKTEALKQTINGTGIRYRYNHLKQKYETEEKPEAFTGIIAGIRADEEGSRSKERIFSPRGTNHQWEIADQPPEFWNHYNTDFPQGTHVRIHPLLDWTELNIWQYIKQEQIPIVSLYFNQGNHQRYRSLGCAPCTFSIDSGSQSINEIIVELEKGKLANVAERSGREQDKEDGGGLEELRKTGYM